MILYGSYNNYQYAPTGTTLFGLNSLNEQAPDSHLMPPNNLGAVDEYDFDIKYMHWIMDNDFIFMNFMSIMMEFYYGRDVYLAVADNDFDWSSVLTESLLKLIQQRYGINATKIETQEDMLYAEESTFTDYGIINFDQDKERYIYLYEKARISNGGKIDLHDT